MSEIIFSLDFLAAVFTLFYILKLTFFRSETEYTKKSLLNQQIAAR